MPYIGNITQDFNVSNAMLDTDSVTSIKIVDGTIEGADIAANLDLSDTQKIRLGAGNDLQIFHDGSNSKIVDTGTGSLLLLSNSFKVQNAAGTENQIIANENGAVELYHDNAGPKLATNANGIETDTIRLGGLNFPRTQISGANVMTFGHGGANSFGELDCLTGMMRIKAGEIQLANRFGNVEMLTCNSFGSVEIFHNGSKKFETTSTGVHVDGELIIDGVVGDLKLNSSGAEIDFNRVGPCNLIMSGSGTFNILGGTPGSADTMAAFVTNGAVELYYDNSKKFETTSTGATLTGTLNTTGNINVPSTNGIVTGSVTTTGSTALTAVDNGTAFFGTGLDLRILHDGTDSYFRNETGELRVQADDFRVRNNANNQTQLYCNAGAQVELYFDNSKKLETTSQGVTIPTGNGLTINGGTGNRTGDATLFVDKTNNNDWTAKFKSNSGSSTDYGIRIECNSGSSFPLVVNSGSDVFRVSGAGAVYATEFHGSGANLTNVHKSYAILLEKLGDTDVGTFTAGAYRTRNLNTELEDPDGIVSLSNNQFTLQAGTYIIRWSCSAFQVDHHSTRIAHISGSFSNGGTEVGSSEYSNNGSEITNRSVGVSLQAPTNANVYEIQHQCTQTINGNGFGVRTMFGADTIATIVEIFKIA